MRRIGFIARSWPPSPRSSPSSAPADDERTYLIEMYNAFGIVEGSDVRVAGVNAGAVTEPRRELGASARSSRSRSAGRWPCSGEDTTCATEPQSLIAEYFIDCQPDGPEIESSGDPEDPDVPAESVAQTVQNDLVNNTLREPFKRRLQLLINEFGTALAGNPENLNEAIRLGAPALTSLEKVLDVLGDQNTIIRDLNVDSDKIIARLAAAPRRRRRASSRRPATRPPPRPSAATTSRPTSPCWTTSSPSSTRPWSSSRRWPARARRCSPTCGPRRPA